MIPIDTSPNLPPLADDSPEAAERQMHCRVEAALADWIQAAPVMVDPPSDALVEQATRLLANLRKWSRR